MQLNNLVSICCVTYNHVNYITQALDGFLMQQTDFLFEIIICDDASTDGTTEIIKEYERKYPDLIRGIYQTENQYSKGLLPYPNFAWPLAKGKYIALCEGDDYWTDPSKLQKQVEFLEVNPEYIACAHESIMQFDAIYNTEDIKTSIAKAPYSENKSLVIDYSFQEVVNTVFFQSSTLVLKNVVSYFPSGCKNNTLWDVALFLFLGGKGKIRYMEEEMSVYRKHPEALTQYGETWRDRISFVKQMLVILKEINAYFSNQYNFLITQKLVDYYLELWFMYKKEGNKLDSSKYLKNVCELNIGKLLMWKKCLATFAKYYRYRVTIIYHTIRHRARQFVKKIIFFGLHKMRTK